MYIKVNLHYFRVGRLVKYFILVDLALIAGWGLIDPIFSVFVIRNIEGATLSVVGVSAAIYWLLKSMVQLPLANFLDRTPGEKDDFYALILGLTIVSVAAFALSSVTTTKGLYLVQAIKSLGFALYSASWPTIFSRHLDKERVSFDWALDSTAVSVSAGMSGFLGSVIAQNFGFSTTFILGGIMSLASAGVLLLAPDLVLPRATGAEPKRKDHIPSVLGK